MAENLEVLKDIFYNQEDANCVELLRALNEFPPLDIEAQVLKAFVLYKLERYSECVVLCDRILVAEPKTVELHSLRSMAVKAMGNERKNKKNQGAGWSLPISSIVVGVVIFIIGIAIMFSEPSSETLNCNENYECVVTQTYMNSIVRTKTFNVDEESTLTMRSRRYRHRNHRYYAYDMIIKDENGENIFPFARYVFRDYSSSKAPRASKIERDFQEYLENPQNGFKSKSNANPIAWIFYGIVTLIIGLSATVFRNEI